MVINRKLKISPDLVKPYKSKSTGRAVYMFRRDVNEWAMDNSIGRYDLTREWDKEGFSTYVHFHDIDDSFAFKLFWM